ncbi:MAG: DUF4194 domain-containing protein [Ornithinimicrobium sp.]
MTQPTRLPTEDRVELTQVVVPLLKGVVYQDDNTTVWQQVHRHRTQITDHMATMGLDLVIDESEGYAYLRQMEHDDLDIPRLVPRHRLSLRVSLLLALLRKRLAEFDASSSDPRLILTRDDIVELMQLHLPSSDNVVRLVADVDALISKAIDLGFVRKVRGQDHTYEVRRIIKAYIDAEWLAGLDARLSDYARALEGER